jgi:hypothetical protein
MVFMVDGWIRMILGCLIFGIFGRGFVVSVYLFKYFNVDRVGKVIDGRVSHSIAPTAFKRCAIGFPEFCLLDSAVVEFAVALDVINRSSL